MKVVALISGGKDSCYNMEECVAMGHEIVALANLQPFKQGENDSYMYQTVGSEAIEMYSQAMGLPLFCRTIKGFSKQTNMTYTEDDEDEVEDLFQLLKSIKSEIEFEGVSSGAILSDYQRLRVEHVCARLNLVSLAYLWRRDQKELLQEMIDNKLEAVLIKTAALGLVPNLHLGKSLKELQEYLISLEHKYGNNVCGEGGEYETFTLDCSLFKKRIVIDDSEIVMHADDGVTQVAYLHLKSLHLEEKEAATRIRKPSAAFDSAQSKTNEVTHTNVEGTAANIESNFEWITDDKLYSTSENLYQSAAISCRGQYVSIGNLMCVYEENASTEDIQAHAKNTFLRLLDLLKSQGHVASDVIYVHLFLAEMSLFGTINSVYKTFLLHNPPSRVCISLNFPNVVSDSKKVLFQMDCISFSNKSKTSNIRNMHVQGISHWAPANIGPYSQCVMVNDTCFVAGQVGFVPGTMLIKEGGIKAQASLSIKHAKSIITAMGSKMGMNNVIQCVCYVTDTRHVVVVNDIWKKAVAGNSGLLKNIAYVTVPTLPRSALVEWQAVASRTPEEETSSDRSNVYALTLFSEKSGKLAIGDVALDLMKKLKTRLDALLLSWKDLLFIRVFYVKQNIVSLDWKGVFQQLSTHFGHVPGISCVPVLNISNGYASSPMAMVCLTVPSAN